MAEHYLLEGHKILFEIGQTTSTTTIFLTRIYCIGKQSKFINLKMILIGKRIASV